VLLSHTLNTGNKYLILPLACDPSMFWDPWEESIPLRGMMKPEMTGHYFIKADSK